MCRRFVFSMVCLPASPAAVMTKTHPHREDTRADNAGGAAPEFASSLHALLEVTRAVRSGDDVGSVLSTIAQGVAQTLGFQTVVLNVYRPEWDDFYVATVHGAKRSAAHSWDRSTTGTAGSLCFTRAFSAPARTSSRMTRSTGRRTPALGSSRRASRLSRDPTDGIRTTSCSSRWSVPTARLSGSRPSGTR